MRWAILRGSVGAVFRVSQHAFVAFPVAFLNLLFWTVSDGTPVVVHPFLPKNAFSSSEFPPSTLEYDLFFVQKCVLWCCSAVNINSTDASTTGCVAAAASSVSARLWFPTRCPFKVSASGLLAVRLTCNSVTAALPLRWSEAQLSSHPAEPHRAGAACLTPLNMEQSLLSSTVRFLLGVSSRPRCSWQLVLKGQPAASRAATCCHPQPSR